MKLNSKINLYKREKRYDSFIILLGVLFGEKLKIEHKSLEWNLEKRYGYNPYYEPHLSSENKEVIYDPWYWLARVLISKQKFNFLKEYQRIKITEIECQ
jgi:hypothetical protein